MTDQHDEQDTERDPDQETGPDVVDRAVQVDDAQHDQDVDDQLEAIDDGGGVVGTGAAAETTTTSDARSEALPFVLTSREHFASVGDVEITGDARVDAATARLEEIPDLPTSDHVAVYDDVHRRLQDALSDAEVR
jgi:microsomal dipeptidase-like Zn-dependent dipeptidase